MKKTQLNPLSQNQRRLLQYAVVIVTIIFIAGWFMFMRKPANDTVYLKDSTLHVFDESIEFTYPDTVEMHGKYLMVVQPEKQNSLIYNLESQELEKNIDATVLDYYEGVLLTNRGAETYLDNKALGVLCEQGVISEINEVLCVTKESPESPTYVVRKIEVDGVEDVYASEYLITDIALINGRLYVGEIDPTTQQSYLVVDREQTKVLGVINIVYEMNGAVHYASFKSALNDKNMYYRFGDNSTVQSNDEVLLFNQDR